MYLRDWREWICISRWRHRIRTAMFLRNAPEHLVVPLDYKGQESPRRASTPHVSSPAPGVMYNCIERKNRLVSVRFDPNGGKYHLPAKPDSYFLKTIPHLLHWYKFMAIPLLVCTGQTLAAVIITTGPFLHWYTDWIYKRMYWHPESFCQTSSWAQWYSASDLPVVPLDGLIVMITAVASQYKYVYKYRNPSCSDVLDLSVCPNHERWNFSVAFHHNFPGTVLLISLANVVCDLSRMTVFTG